MSVKKIYWLANVYSLSSLSFLWGITINNKVLRVVQIYDIFESIPNIPQNISYSDENRSITFFLFGTSCQHT